MSTHLLRPDNHELATQHSNWSAARGRLWHAPAPRPRLSQRRPISPFNARRIEAETPPEPTPPPKPAPSVPWRRIVLEVAEKHRVTHAMIVGQSRERRTTAARHEAVFRVFCETLLSLPEIGMRFGGRDHTTALHSLRWCAKHVDGAAAILEAAKEQRYQGQQAHIIAMGRRAREMQREGKTLGQILGVLVISESGLRRALQAVPRGVNEPLRDAIQGNASLTSEATA
jgi:hypothetical protein